MDNEFHPNSIDAVLARTNATLERVEQRLQEGDTEMKSLRKDVESLKKWRAYVVGLAAGAGLIIRAGWEWVTNHGGKH